MNKSTLVIVMEDCFGRENLAQKVHRKKVD